MKGYLLFAALCIGLVVGIVSFVIATVLKATFNIDSVKAEIFAVFLTLLLGLCLGSYLFNRMDQP